MLPLSEGGLKLMSLAPAAAQIEHGHRVAGCEVSRQALCAFLRQRAVKGEALMESEDGEVSHSVDASDAACWPPRIFKS